MGEPLAFVNPEKDPEHYVRRYLNEPDYKAWFHRNYPNYTIYQGIGITEQEFKDIIKRLGPKENKTESEKDNKTEPETKENKTELEKDNKTEPDGLTKLKELAKDLKEKPASKESSIEPRGEDLAKSIFNSYPDEQTNTRRTFEEFVDERVLVSRDLFGKKEMKIKILEVSDERQESKIRWKFGDRVKVNKIIITIKHLDSMEVEEGEFDIEAIEKELAEKRHYSSTNRWIPSSDIKNGYVVNSKHTALISDAVALDYIIF